MEYANLPHILTPDEVAEYLKIDKNAVIKELEDHKLHGFKAGSEWRVTDQSLLEFTNGMTGLSSNYYQQSVISEDQSSEITIIGAFDYKWPANEEHFDIGFETQRCINGKTHTFKVGFTNREAAGKMRRRVVVWMDNWPLVEFAAGNNYEADGMFASIIKNQNGKQLRPSAKISPEYSKFRIDRYDSVVQGPYASKNMAIIVHKDDLESMLKHAFIRATWKNII
jgi:excisionase family DNA binding protein